MEESYFPPSSLDVNPYSDEFKQEWYTRCLKAMKEPVLSRLKDREREVYRFLWLRTFDQPIAIRLARCRNECIVEVKELDGKSGFEVGTLSRSTSDTVSFRKWKRFVSLLETADFWELPLDKLGLVVDGAMWILEGYRSKRYQVVNRHCPQVDGPDTAFRRACLHLVRLAGVEVPPSRIY